MTSTLSPGQRVKVPEFTGTVVRVKENKLGRHQVYIQVSGSGEQVVSLDRVELLEPPYWPPQVGDVWVTPDGVDWYVRKFTTSSGTMMVTPFDRDTVDGYYFCDYEDGGGHIGAPLSDFLQLWPVLVRRRDVHE